MSDTMRDILAASDRLGAILAWHLAMPLVDHDGGDEDDRLVETRRFLRAARKPRARLFFRDGHAYVVQAPDPLMPLVPMSFTVNRDAGDEDRCTP